MDPSNNSEKKPRNKSRIARFILAEGAVSKPEISSALKISMPTVLQNTKELIGEGIVKESGEYASTGGRKAKALSIVPDGRYALGIHITAGQISLVLINLKGEILRRKQVQQPYVHSAGYYKGVKDNAELFICEAAVNRAKLLGTGICLPGIIDPPAAMLVKSHSLHAENISLQVLSQYFDREPAYENDARSAAMAELRRHKGSAVYLSLSDTVSGAICLDRSLYRGDHFRSAQFGHTILVPGGKTCRCGKEGCVDAYCSAHVLTECSEGNLETFFHKLESRDMEATDIWDRYLDGLAIAVSNLRMNFDCDIILGGRVGAFLEPYRTEIGNRILQYNCFDRDSSYLHICRCTQEASAIGAALVFVDRYLDQL